jgi:hypothetical protein
MDDGLNECSAVWVNGVRNQKYTINQYTLLNPRLYSLNANAFKAEHIIGTVFHWHRIPLVPNSRLDGYPHSFQQKAIPLPLT